MDEGRLWNLTPYEVDRAPHPIPKDDGRVIHTTARLLESELQCSICLEILRNTRTTKDCLHRFCDECIQKALRNGNKECPNCRAKLISMRSLRPDPLFDDIIRTIFPERYIEDERQATALALSLVSPKSATASRGAQLSPNATGNTVATGLETGDLDITMSMEIFPYKEKMQHHASVVGDWLPFRRLVKVTSAATVSQVCMFIVSRLSVEQQCLSSVDVSDGAGVELYVQLRKNEYQLLTPRSSLKEVYEKYWNISRPIQLCFALSDDFRLGKASTSTV